MKSCDISEADRAAAKAKAAAAEKEAKQNAANSIVAYAKGVASAMDQFNAGSYDEAFRLANDNAIAAEALESTTLQKPGPLTSSALSRLSWYGLFVHQYARALEAAERSLKIEYSLAGEANRAHALMLLDRTLEAMMIYGVHKGELLRDKVWEKAIADDFATLRQAGITNPQMTEIETALAPPEQSSIAAKQRQSPTPPRPVE
jgi:hypothetical protein